MKLPDITPAQIFAGVTWLITQAVSLGLLNNTRGQAILQITGTAIPFAWIVADAVIRHGRNKARAALITAGRPDPVLTTAPKP